MTLQQVAQLVPWYHGFEKPVDLSEPLVPEACGGLGHFCLMLSKGPQPSPASAPGRDHQLPLTQAGEARGFEKFHQDHLCLFLLTDPYQTML